MGPVENIGVVPDDTGGDWLVAVTASKWLKVRIRTAAPLELEVVAIDFGRKIGEGIPGPVYAKLRDTLRDAARNWVVPFAP